LLDASLVELSRGEYALAIVMSAKNDIFDNWMECDAPPNPKFPNRWIKFYQNSDTMWCTPKLLDRFNYKSKVKTT
jgi:hypothetical protein